MKYCDDKRGVGDRPRKEPYKTPFCGNSTNQSKVMSNIFPQYVIRNNRQSLDTDIGNKLKQN